MADPVSPFALALQREFVKWGTPGVGDFETLWLDASLATAKTIERYHLWLESRLNEAGISLRAFDRRELLVD
jgi:hypothetical protein